jgi:RHS repeat-associated protein
MGGQTGTLLPNGNWLLLGGRGTNGPQDTVAVRDQFTGETVELPAKLGVPRAGHSATMLPDGRILIFGGVGKNGKVVSKAEVFNSRTLGFEQTLPSTLPSPRAYHTATLLPDEKVLIVGGQLKDEGALASAEFWDSKTGVSTVLSSGLNTARQKHEAILLADGNILFQGGLDSFGNELAAAAEIFNPETRAFTWVGTYNDQMEKGTPFLAMSLPADGATDVQADSKIALLFSKRLRADTVNSETCKLIGPDGEVAISVVPTENGTLAFLTPLKPLRQHTGYNVFVSGSVDTRNQLVTSTAFTFTTAGKSEDDQRGDAGEGTGLLDSEKWTPNAQNLKGNWRSDYPETHWQKLPPLQAPPGVTAVAGQVLTLDGKPLANVTLQISGVSAHTDSTGRFLLQSINAGQQVLNIDGRTANKPGRTYGIFRVAVKVSGSKTDVLGYTIWMPRLDMEHAVNISSPTSSDVTITNPDIPGLELRLPAGTLIRGIDGETVTQISITPVPVDRPPFPLPPGINVPVFFTIQPGGAQIIPPRARVVYPNYTNESPGTRIDFWNYDPTEKGWYVYGQGTVTSDGKQVDPDPGVVIYEFSGVMINSGESPPSDAPVPDAQEDGEPVDLGTGLFVHRKTDLYLPDVIPLVLTRTYRANDFSSRPFGIGATHPYQMFMWSARQYREADLILPDGGRVHFERTSPGESFVATFLSTTNPGQFYKSELRWVSNGFEHVDVWHLTLRDGTILVFGENAPLQAIIDRNGNRLNVSRAGVNQFGSPIGNVTKVTSPSGKYLEFTYSGNLVSKVKDSAGREVNYTYDGSGRLWKVTDANGGVTEYTYDSSHRMLTVKDARGIIYLTNEYDTNGRVAKQTLADDTPAITSDNPTYSFNYVTNSGGKIAQTSVTDPRGNVRRVTFNDTGYWLTNTQAVGKPEEQTTSVERQAKTNFVLSATDPLGRKTAYTREDLGRVTSVTRLAQTAEAMTTRYTYYGFNPASITDHTGRITSFSYDENDTLVTVIDSLGRRTVFDNNTQGQPISVKDPLGNMMYFGYQSGVLVSIADQLGRSASRYVDDAGRMLAATDALGQTVRYEYDALNQLVKTTDPQSGVTEFSYDPNGNLLSVKDPRQKITTYTYDNMDRVSTRTDSLQGATSLDRYEYDLAGNLKKFTDRKGQVRAYGYDNVNRLSFAGFGQTQGGAYESTINYAYDTAGRLTTALDSISGTITLDYDNLDRLASEATPQGIVAYSYDAVGRRKTMTIPGQAVVNYDYDEADRAIAVTQGTTAVSFSYDDANRLTSKTLPNGVLEKYEYDAASQLTGIVYQAGSTVLGDLNYEYDNAGRRTVIEGSLARIALPQTLTSATHDDANRLTQNGAATLTYDANGNLTNDGVNTYTWDARDQLASTSGASLSATFSYDAFGRRSGKTINGETTEFLYDGLNAVQEKTGGVPSANLLVGGVDEVFTRADGTGAQTLLRDGLDSTLALVDSSGSVLTEYTYEPFGNTTTSGTTSSNPSQYTGRENDGTGLYYYRARYYSPTLQRFISEDPIGLMGGPNLYAYVENRVPNFKDPLGRDLVGVVGGGTAGAAVGGLGIIANVGYLIGINTNCKCEGYESVGGAGNIGIGAGPQYGYPEQKDGSGGLGATVGAGGGLFWSNAPSYAALQGPFQTTIISTPFNVGVEIDKSGDIYVASLTYGKGLGAGVFHLTTNTPKWTTWDTKCRRRHTILI